MNDIFRIIAGKRIFSYVNYLYDNRFNVYKREYYNAESTCIATLSYLTYYV